MPEILLPKAPVLPANNQTPWYSAFSHVVVDQSDTSRAKNNFVSDSYLPVLFHYF